MAVACAQVPTTMAAVVGGSPDLVIVLPAYLGGDIGVAGVKWIASFPENIHYGLSRASAVLILNDYLTGYPFAFLEASYISAVRTAASAVLAARTLARQPTSVGIVGAGVIARKIVDYLAAIGYLPADTRCHDLDATYASRLACYVGSDAHFASLDSALDADLVVFATTAPSPYVDANYRFAPSQTVLNVSLRDLYPETLEAANNVVDDVDHCLKADTSLHLLEKKLGHRGFVNGTLAGALLGRLDLDPDRPTVFSPFGLGVLDLAVGSFVWRETREAGLGLCIPSFYGSARRW